MFGKNKYWEYAGLINQHYFAYHKETSKLVLAPSYDLSHSIDRNDLFLNSPTAIYQNENGFKYILCINAASNGKDVVYVTYDSNGSPAIGILKDNDTIGLKLTGSFLLASNFQDNTIYLIDYLTSALVKLDIQTLQTKSYHVSNFIESPYTIRINETPYNIFVTTTSISYIDFDSQKYVTWDLYNLYNDYICLQDYIFETDNKVYIVCDLNYAYEDIRTCPSKQLLIVIPKPLNINNFKNAAFIELSNKLLSLSPSFVSVYNSNDKSAECYKRDQINDVLNEIIASGTVIDKNSLSLNESDLSEASNSYSLEKLDSFNPHSQNAIVTQIPNLYFFDDSNKIDIPHSLVYDNIEAPYSETYDGQIFKCNGNNCQEIAPKVKCQNAIHELEKIDDKIPYDPTTLNTTGCHVYKYAYDNNKVTIIQPRITFPLKFIDYESEDATFLYNDNYKVWIDYNALSMSIDAKDKQILKDFTTSTILSDTQRKALIDQLSYDNEIYTIDLDSNHKLKTKIKVVKPDIDDIGITVTVSSPYNPYHINFTNRDEDTLFNFEIPYSISFYETFRLQWIKKVVINNQEYQTDINTETDYAYVMQPKAIATSSTVSLYTDFGYVGDMNLTKTSAPIKLTAYPETVTYSYDFKPYGLITFVDNKFVAIKAKYPLQKLLNGYFDESKYGEVFALVDDNGNSFTSDSHKVHMIDKDRICVYGGPSCQFIMFNDKDNPTSAIVYNIQVNQANYIPFMFASKIGYVNDYGIYIYDFAANTAKKINVDLSLPDYYTKVCYAHNNKLFIVPYFIGDTPDDQTVHEVPLTIVDLDNYTVSRYTIKSDDTNETAMTCYVRYIDNQTLEIAFSTFDSYVTVKIIRYNTSNNQVTTVGSVIADQVYITENGNYAFVAFAAGGSGDYVGILDNNTIKWYKSDSSLDRYITLVDSNALFYISRGTLAPLVYYDNQSFQTNSSSNTIVTKQNISYQVEDANSDVQQKPYNVQFISELY